VIRYYVSVVRASKRSLVQVVQAVRHRGRSNDMDEEHCGDAISFCLFTYYCQLFDLTGLCHVTLRISDPRISLAWVRIIIMTTGSIWVERISSGHRTLNTKN
jgi:hypothetical protein